MGELLETANSITGSRAELIWRDPKDILAAGIKPWKELPIWLPPGRDYDFVYNSDTTKAYEAGLRVRPIAQTIQDTWEWLTTREVPASESPVEGRVVGLDAEKEQKFVGVMA